VLSPPPLLTPCPSKTPRRQCYLSHAERSTATAGTCHPPILRSHTGRRLSVVTASTSLSTTIDRSVYLFSIAGDAMKVARGRGVWYSCGCRRIQPSKRFRQTCLPCRRISFHACIIRSGDLGSRPERNIVRSCHPKSAHIHAIKTNTKCAPARRETHYEAAAASSTCVAARQELGRDVVRHFCDWLWCPRVQTKPAASQHPEALLQGTVMARRQGRLRGGLDVAELVT
jgi:hypothetical protein